MSITTHDVRLAGCSPTPLAHYLKALGILRLVAEQVDADAMGWWQHDTFWLRSSLSADELTEFFANDYSPTPLVAPWNGGSGFYPKDNQEAMNTILAGNEKRLEPYRFVIAQCHQIISESSAEIEKAELLQIFRNRLPDFVIAWLDAAFVLTESGPKYPPLLGTGGNDGRLEFTNNFMQHLCTLVDAQTENPTDVCIPQFLESAFARLSASRRSATIGQFDPGSVGGSNSSSGFEAKSTVNSWDYILMLEGAMTFAAASVKRLESHSAGNLAYPFCVRTTGVGYESSNSSDESTSRAEIWLPLWDTPAHLRAIGSLLSEGRVETQRRHAKNGMDFARAITSLGVDRGITEFQRVGFQQRNGLAYFAIPLGRFSVRANPGVDVLLSPIDQWLDRFRRAATGKTAPARAGRALRRLESAIIKLCQSDTPANVQATLVALGEAEASVAISKQLRDGGMGGGISPLPKLDAQWLLNAYDGSREFRLAASLASVTHKTLGPIQRHVEPIDWQARFPKWLENADDPSVVWLSGSLTTNLCRVLNRRLIENQSATADDGQPVKLAPLRSRLFTPLSDVTSFIDGSVNDDKIDSLFRALCLIDYGRSAKQESALVKHVSDLAATENLSDQEPELLELLQGYLPYDANDSYLFKQAMAQIGGYNHSRPLPDAIYSLLKLCFLPHKLFGTAIVLKPQIIRRALAGDAAEATQLAARRLRASGFKPALERAVCSARQIQRIAAAILFPIHGSAAMTLAKRVLVSSASDAAEELIQVKP